MIHYTQIIWEEVAFIWKVTGKAVAISIAPTVPHELALTVSYFLRRDSTAVVIGANSLYNINTNYKSYCP